MFRDQLAEKLLDTRCTEFEFYHVKLSLCDKESQKAFEVEKDSIAILVSEYEEKLLALTNQNNELKERLKSITRTSRQAERNDYLLENKIEINNVLQKGRIYQASNFQNLTRGN